MPGSWSCVGMRSPRPPPPPSPRSAALCDARVARLCLLPAPPSTHTSAHPAGPGWTQVPPPVPPQVALALPGGEGVVLLRSPVGRGGTACATSSGRLALLDPRAKFRVGWVGGWVGLLATQHPRRGGGGVCWAGKQGEGAWPCRAAGARLCSTHALPRTALQPYYLARTATPLSRLTRVTPLPSTRARTCARLLPLRPPPSFPVACSSRP